MHHILSSTTTFIIICIYCILLLLCNYCCTTIIIHDVTAVSSASAAIIRTAHHRRMGKSSLFRIYQFRGGASKIEDSNNINNKNNNNNNNNNSKSKSNNSSSSNNINNKNNNTSQLSSSLRQFWKIGKKSWKFAVERVSPSWRLPSWRPLAFRSDNSNDNDNISSNINESGVATSNTTTGITTAITTTATTNEQQYGDDSGDDDDNTAKIMTSTLSLKSSRPSYYSPFRMYLSCMGIVSLWILTGTLFYSYYNEWPIPQSFFYAVDAGMSIGFCTDVAETKLGSKAFTVIYILLGASVVGGALALFIQDIVEGVFDRETQLPSRGDNNGNDATTSNHYIKGYNLSLEKEVFEKFDVSQTGTLSKEEFRQLLQSTIKTTTRPLSEDDIDILWTKFDRIKDGTIHFEEFVGSFRKIDRLIASLHSDNENNNTMTKNQNDNDDDNDDVNCSKWCWTITNSIHSKILSTTSSIYSSIISTWNNENRIYGVFIAWVLLGIAWGMIDQGWDPITSTHFAVSALATGGLTAPPVNSDGILPARPSIFCGCYCLFGIPLMAITLGHFARVLVSDHVAAMEEWALTRPMTATEYQIAKKYLTKASTSSPPPMTMTTTTTYSSKLTKEGRSQRSLSPPPPPPSTASRGLCLSDFIVLQLLRQGRISAGTMNILKKEFDVLDKDRTGVLTLEEATNWCSIPKVDEDDDVVSLPSSSSSSSLER